MPVHQATPGPSTGIFQNSHINTRKRSISEPDNNSYNRGKKAKQDDENRDTVAKDKSKKTRARKRKRKQSVTTASMSPRSKSRSVPATQQTPSSTLLDTQTGFPPASQNGLTEMDATAPDDVSHVVTRYHKC